MTDNMKPTLTRWDWWAWFGMTMVGLVLVFFRISHGSIWSDEAVTMLLTEHGFDEVLRFVGQGGDSHPPLYHLAVKGFTDILGRSRGVFRGFSALGLLATALLLGVGPVSRIFNPRVGLIYAFLMLFASMNLTQAQEMRMYSWATFLISACAAMGYLYVRDGKRRDLFFFGLSSLGGVYIHYYSTLGVFFVHLYLLLWILLGKKDRLRPFMGEAIVVMLLFSPWIFSLVTQVTRNVEHFWISAPTFETLVGIFTIPFAAKTGFMSHIPILASVCLLLYGYGLVMAWKKRMNPVFLVLSAGVFISVLLVVLIFSLTLRPIIVPRYMLPLWGLLFMGVAWGLYQVFEWRSKLGRIVGYGFLLLYALLAIPSLNLLYFFQLNGPMDDIRMFGRKNFHRGQVFLHFDENTLPGFVVEFPEYQHLVYRSPDSIFYDPLITLVIRSRSRQTFARLQPVTSSSGSLPPRIAKTAKSPARWRASLGPTQTSSRSGRSRNPIPTVKVPCKARSGLRPRFRTLSLIWRWCRELPGPHRSTSNK
jgi:hypothetical protein